ncbi:MAG: hypothetical protein IPI49_07050 [Myxococcales bacterium]|nr:hypothetical protein [Myxococcales bacterium]
MTKGVHSGPEFALATRNGQTESDYEVMLAWLRAEQRARAAMSSVATAPRTS